MAVSEECRTMGIIVLPPNINLSDADFKIESDKKITRGRAIRFGFTAIKNVGTAAIDNILMGVPAQLTTRAHHFIAGSIRKSINGTRESHQSRGIWPLASGRSY
jgi:DNA polymerase III alpha subunit